MQLNLGFSLHVHTGLPLSPGTRQILTVHRKDLFSCRPLLDVTLWNLTLDHERLSYSLGLCFSIEILKIYPSAL